MSLPTDELQADTMGKEPLQDTLPPPPAEPDVPAEPEQVFHFGNGSIVPEGIASADLHEVSVRNFEQPPSSKGALIDMANGFRARFADSYRSRLQTLKTFTGLGGGALTRFENRPKRGDIDQPPADNASWWHSGAGMETFGELAIETLVFRGLGRVAGVTKAATMRRGMKAGFAASVFTREAGDSVEALLDENVLTGTAYMYGLANAVVKSVIEVAGPGGAEAAISRDAHAAIFRDVMTRMTKRGASRELIESEAKRFLFQPARNILRVIGEENIEEFGQRASDDLTRMATVEGHPGPTLKPYLDIPYATTIETLPTALFAMGHRSWSESRVKAAYKELVTAASQKETQAAVTVATPPNPDAPDIVIPPTAHPETLDKAAKMAMELRDEIVKLKGVSKEAAESVAQAVFNMSVKFASRDPEATPDVYMNDFKTAVLVDMTSAQIKGLHELLDKPGATSADVADLMRSSVKGFNEKIVSMRSNVIANEQEKVNKSLRVELEQKAQTKGVRILAPEQQKELAETLGGAFATVLKEVGGQPFTLPAGAVKTMLPEAVFVEAMVEGEVGGVKIGGKSYRLYFRNRVGTGDGAVVAVPEVEAKAEDKAAKEAEKGADGRMIVSQREKHRLGGKLGMIDDAGEIYRNIPPQTALGPRVLIMGEQTESALAMLPPPAPDKRYAWLADDAGKYSWQQRTAEQVKLLGPRVWLMGEGETPASEPPTPTMPETGPAVPVVGPEGAAPAVEPAPASAPAVAPVVEMGKINPRIPLYVEEEMVRLGKNPRRLLNEIDAARPEDAEALASDPITIYFERTNPEMAKRARAGDLSKAEYQAIAKEMESRPRSISAAAPPASAGPAPQAPPAGEAVSQPAVKPPELMTPEEYAGADHPELFINAIDGKRPVLASSLEGPYRDQLDYAKRMGYVREGDRYVFSAATPEAEYDAAHDAWKVASRAFMDVQKAYRSKKVGDEEFLAGKAAFDIAQSDFDAAEQKFIDAKNAAFPRAPLPAHPTPATVGRKIMDRIGLGDGATRAVPAQQPRTPPAPLESRGAAQEGFTIGPLHHWTEGGGQPFSAFKGDAIHVGTAAQARGVLAAKKRAAGIRGDIPIDRYEVYIKDGRYKRVQDVGNDRGWSEEARKAKAEGYDGLVYENLYEGRGGDSYAVFDSRNVRIAAINGKPVAAPLESRGEAGAGRYAVAGDVVDGRVVRSEIPNQSSIESTLDNYAVLPGVREVPMSEFELTGKSYSADGDRRISELAEEIKASGEIAPLIVVIEKDGPYILEGATRVDALYRLGAKSFPALVVVNNDDPPLTSRPAHRGPTHGMYISTENLAIFFATATPETVIHEWFHHLTEQDLLPSADMEILRRSFGSGTGTGAGDDKKWDANAAERAVNAFIAYVVQGELPRTIVDPQLFRSFQNIRAAFAAAYKNIEQQYGQTPEGKAAILPEATATLFDQWFEMPGVGEAEARWRMVGDNVAAATANARDYRDIENEVLLERWRVDAMDEGAVRRLAFSENMGGEDGVRAYAAAQGFTVEEGHSGWGQLSDEQRRAYVEGKLQAIGFVSKKTTDEASQMFYGKSNYEALTPDERADLLLKLKGEQDRVIRNAFRERMKALAQEKLSESLDDIRAAVIAEQNALPRSRSMRAKAVGGEGMYGHLAQKANHFVNAAKNLRASKFRRLGQYYLNDFREMIYYLSDGNQPGSALKEYIGGDWEAMQESDARVQEMFDTHQEEAKKRIGDMTGLQKVVALGKEGREFTLNDAIGIYMQTRTGIIEGEVNAFIAANLNTMSDAEARQVIADAAKAVESTPAAKNFVAFIDDMLGFVYEPVSTVHQKLAGAPLPKKAFYFPRIHVDGSFVEGDWLMGAADMVPNSKGEHPMRPPIEGRMQERTLQNAWGAPISTDAVGILDRTVRQAAAYVGRSEHINRMSLILNDRRVSEAFSKRFGGESDAGTGLELLKALKDHLYAAQFVTGRLKPMEGVEPYLRTLRFNMQMSLLGARPKSVLTQPVSFINALSEIPSGWTFYAFGQFTSALKSMMSHPLDALSGRLNPFDGYEQWELLKRLDPYTAQRYREPYRQDIEASLGKKGLMNKEVHGRPLYEWMLGMFRNFDLLSVIPVWNTAYEAEFARLRNSMPEPEAQKLAVSEARRVVGLTQAPGSQLERNIAQMSNEWVRGFLMFTSEPLKSWQYWRNHIVGDLARAYNRAGGGQVGVQKMLTVFWTGEPGKTSIKRRIFFQCVAPAMVMGYLFRRRLPEWDEWWTDLLGYNISKAPVIGPYIQTRMLYDWRDASLAPNYLDWGTRMGQVLGDTLTGEVNERTVKDLSRALSDPVGIPAILVEDAWKFWKGKPTIPELAGLEVREREEKK